MAETERVSTTPEEMFILFGRMAQTLDKIENQLGEINAQVGMMNDSVLGFADSTDDNLERLTFAIGQVLMHISKGGEIMQLVNAFVKGKPQPPARKEP